MSRNEIIVSTEEMERQQREAQAAQDGAEGDGEDE